MAKRKKAVEPQVEVVAPVEEVVAPVIKVQKVQQHKCIECGAVNETPRCGKCGSHLSRKL